MELTVLGTSSALPTSERYPSAHVLNVHERFFLIDCGEGTQIQIRRNKLRFSKINDIFISHLHGDHVFGIFGLLSTFSLMGRKSKIRMYAPEAFERILKMHFESFEIKLDYEIEFIALAGDEKRVIFEDDDLTVSAFPLEHRVPTYGFLFKEKPGDRLMRKECIEKYNIPIARISAIKKGADFVDEKGEVISNDILTMPPAEPLSYAYCSDTMYFSKLATYVKDVTLLYHEATYDKSRADQAVIRSHSTSLDAARVAKDANAKKLLLGHFSSRYKSTELLVNEARTIFPESYAAVDGNKYVV